MEDKNPDLKKSLDEIVSEYRSTKNLNKIEEDRLESQKQRRKTFINFVKFCLFFLAIFLVLRLFFILTSSTMFSRDNKNWAQGVVETTDYKIDKCIFNLWLLRKGIDLYYVTFKDYPDSPEYIYKEGFIVNRLLCPVTKKAYVSVVVNGKRAFSCPNPEKHGVKELYLHLEEGPPIINR